LKNYFVHIGDTTTEDDPSEHQNDLFVTVEQYRELLLNLSEFNLIDEFLKSQLFSCGKCRSFSIKARALYPVLEKIAEYDGVAESILYDLREYTDFDPRHLELLYLPDEIKEKFLDKDSNYYEMEDAMKSGDFVIEDDVVYQFPYENCSFVFDANCACNHILRS